MHTLGCRENASNFTGALVANLLLRLELTPLGLDGGDAFSLPATAQIDLLALPVFDKDDAPKRIHDGVDDRVAAQEKPAPETKDCGKDKEAKVCLEEREVKADLLLVSAQPLYEKILGALTLSPNLLRIWSKSSSERKVF